MKYLTCLLFCFIVGVAYTQPTYKTTINVGTGGVIPGGGMDSIVYVSNKLSSDVALVSAVTWYDGPSVTLSAGTWLVNSVITVYVTNGIAIHNISCRITDGTIHYASTQNAAESNTPQSQNVLFDVPLTTILTLSEETPIKVQVYRTTGGGISYTVLAAIMNGSSGNNASQINAIKLSN